MIPTPLPPERILQPSSRKCVMRHRLYFGRATKNTVGPGFAHQNVTFVCDGRGGVDIARLRPDSRRWLAALVTNRIEWDVVRIEEWPEDVFHPAVVTCGTCGHPIQLDAINEVYCGVCGQWHDVFGGVIVAPQYHGGHLAEDFLVPIPTRGDD